MERAGGKRKLAQGTARVLRGRLALRPNEVSPQARLRTAVRSARDRLGADVGRAHLGGSPLAPIPTSTSAVASYGTSSTRRSLLHVVRVLGP